MQQHTAIILLANYLTFQSTAYGNGLCFSLGGRIGVSESTAISDDGYSTPGMVVFNSSTQQWYNVSADGVSSGGTALNGAAHFVPAFGPEGLLLVLGGTPSAPPTYFPFDDIPIYDPQSRQWSSQRASGQIPPSREVGCVVGVEGNNTYEVGLIFSKALYALY